jgi:uncharacterized protein
MQSEHSLPWVRLMARPAVPRENTVSKLAVARESDTEPTSQSTEPDPYFPERWGVGAVFFRAMPYTVGRSVALRRVPNLPEDIQGMRNGSRVGVVIPALNEEKSIGKVLSAIPDWVDEVVVADNGSSDRTAEIAEENGARVVHEPRRGYGAACLAAIRSLKDPDIILFMDGDYSDHPEESDALIDPIASDKADMVIGSRVLGKREAGALTPQARFGNWLACLLIRLFWKVRFTDLGPFRAIGFHAFEKLHMGDLDYGWTVEMQIKAAKAGLRVLEVPVSYRRRIGKSKVSGALRGIVGAGTKILYTIFKSAVNPGPGPEGQYSEERIIVFTRYPRAGMVKTRLAPVLGEQGAADVHKRMTEHLMRRVMPLKDSRRVAVEVRYDGGGRSAMSRWLGSGIAYRQQRGSDLGERMTIAFQEAFAHGSKRVLLIGSDCPGITSSLLEQGLDALRTHDLAFGPAADGGYYLVGLKQNHPSLFSGLAWGTAGVLEQTRGIAERLNLSMFLTARLRDVDRPEDLVVWEHAKTAGESPVPLPNAEGAAAPGRPDLQDRDKTDDVQGSRFGLFDSPSIPKAGNHPGTHRCRISVIIPTLNEAHTIPAALASAGLSDEVEAIVVDGGSTDETIVLAESLGAKAIRSPKGRGSQMNRGAAEATGDILLFLHADTRLPEDWTHHVRRELSRPGVAVGAFRFHTDGTGWSLGIIECLTNFRATWLQMPYGDQALFVRVDLFQRIGGFPDLPVMEDFEFVRQARKHGRTSIAHATVETSSRRWKRHGIWRTSAMNQVVILGHLLGISTAKLLRLRGSDRDSPCSYREK